MSDQTLEIEQYLQDKDVFLNGFTNKPCHMDSYMTVIDFSNLEKAAKENKFTKEEWLKAIESWAHHAYLTPILGLLAKTTKRWIDANSFFSF
jgi:hypothetical protein